MKPYFLLTSAILCVSVAFTDVHAQCSVPAPPASPTCGAPGQTVLTSGATVASGTVYYYSGVGTLTGVTNNGGTIVVCGTLTLSYPNLSSGSVIVASTGSLTISDIPIPGPTNPPNAIQTSIVNYGTLTIKGLAVSTNINFNASLWNYGAASITSSATFNAFGLYNANATSSLVVSGNLSSSGAIVNNGAITDKEELTVTTGPGVCLGGGSVLSVASLFDDATADYFTVSPSPSGGNSATISVSGGFASNWNPLTSTSNLDFCEGPAETNSISGNVGAPGSATIEPGCTPATLPVTLLSFTAETGYGNACTLSWTTTEEIGLKDFDIEYSLNGSDYLPLASVPAHGEPSGYTYPTTLQGKTWFRLRMDNNDNSYVYSAVVLANYSADKSAGTNTILVQPNLITGGTLPVWSHMETARSGEWIVVDMTGRIIFREGVHLSAGISNTDIQLPTISSGMYRLLFLCNQLKLTPAPFSVIR